MNFWRKRKKAPKFAGASLSLEKLEDRAMMAVIPIASGQTTTFQDADGTQVNVRLTGPGQGSLELVGGVLTGAAIDSLELTGTTGTSKLKISTRGGAVSGTTINDLVITKALNELGALKHLKAKDVDFATGGQFTADGNIDNIQFRTLGIGANLDVTGSVGKMKIHTLASNADVDVAGSLNSFVAELLGAGSNVSASQLDKLKVKQQAVGTTFDVGAGGLGKATIKDIYSSAIASEGNIGEIVVKGNAIGTTLTSNIDAGSDDVYGTIDDFVINSAMAGNISTVKLRGFVGAAGTNQEVDIVTSGQVGKLSLGRTAQQSGNTPAMWLGAAQGLFPLSVVQAAASATGFTDDEIWISVFGQELGAGSKAGNYYYLDPSNINDLGIPTLVETSGTPSSSTPNLPTLPSFTLNQWKIATNAWGSGLAFRIPRDGNEWTGRVLISAGAPVQAQINANGSIASPSASDTIDPSTGSFYDFLEFTVTGGASVATSSLDIDTSLVDSFGIPMALQLFQTLPGVTNFTGTLTANSNSVTGIVSTAGLAVGQSIVGTNIPLGATITAITPSTTMLARLDHAQHERRSERCGLRNADGSCLGQS